MINPSKPIALAVDQAVTAGRLAAVRQTMAQRPIQQAKEDVARILADGFQTRQIRKIIDKIA